MTLPHSAGVYCLRNITNGHCYVGSSGNMYVRMYAHRGMLQRGTHHSRYLQRAWERYGASAFVWEVLEMVPDRAHLLEREQAWLDQLRPAYNRGLVATGRIPGSRHSEATKAKMSAAHKGHKQTPEWAAKRAQAWVGRKHTAESRAKMLGRVPTSKGKPMSEEQKAKIAAALRGKPKSPEHRAHLSAATRAYSATH